MAAEEVVGAYATKLFIRSEAEARRPVVLLSGERTNVYGVLEKHFRETALPPSERFWRTVRSQWTPMLDTWRPRVNGVQLKVLAGARLPEGEEEWTALRAALASVRQHLRPDSSVDLILGELRDFVAMVVSWWENRKKTDNAGSSAMLLKRAASAGLLLGAGAGASVALGPPAKKPCLDYIQLGPPHHPPAPTLYSGTLYAAPEIVPVPLLTGAGGSGRLPDRLPLGPPQGSNAAVEELGVPGENGTQHGGSGYLQHLPPGPTDSQLFDQLFQPGAPPAGPAAPAGAAPHAAGTHSPRAQLEAAAAAVAAGGTMAGYHPQSPKEGSADNQGPRPGGPANGGIDGKRFVTLNVGGHRFLTTAATLAAVDGSYFCKLAQQASQQGGGRGGSAEFFVDRSGKIFEYVLDHLRSRRFNDSPSTLPKDERTLSLLAREAEFYQLPELADRARAALVVPPAAGDDTPSDVPANITAEGSAHGGHLLGRLAAPAVALQLQQVQAQQQQQQQAQQAAAAPCSLDALFVETGFQQACELAGAHASLLEELNATVAGKQAEGYSVVDFKCGTEREGGMRNLFYHVLLRKPGAA
ncbi:hypothetical protein ABPG75_005533 [Micractinium tetrahymenae]